MKHKINLKLAGIIFLGGICNFVNSQEEWEINGNSSITTANYLGTRNSSPLQIRTNNTTTPQPIIFQTNGATERLRITPTGFVGVGITNPLSLLHLKSATTGEMFRTDGKADAVNLWRMYTGGREKFRLSVPSGSDNVHFRVNQNADMILETNSTPRLFLKIS